MDKLHNGHGSPYDFTEIESSASVLLSMSHCGLGHTACNPVLDTIAKFDRPTSGGWNIPISPRPSTSTGRFGAARQMTGRTTRRPIVPEEFGEEMTS